VLYVDQQVLNFEKTLPGKLLGSSLVVGNYSDCDQIVELSIDVQSFSFSRQKILQKYKKPYLPFDLRTDFSKDSILNSEVKTESWFIENPHSKDLTKRITIKLGPQAEQAFVIVQKAP